MQEPKDEKQNSQELKQAEPIKETGKKKGLLAKIKGIKHIELVLAGVAVLVMLLIFFSSGCGGGGGGVASGTTNNNNRPTNETRTQRIERQLSESFSKIEGAGETIVIINWESGLESTVRVAGNNNNNTNSNPNPIVIGGGGGLSGQNAYPRALGVLILTQGGDNVRLQIELINAVSVFLDITPDRIRILTLAS